MRRQAFTLIELLVVIAIIAVLAALLIPAIGMLRHAQRSHAATIQLSGLKLALSKYINSYGLLGDLADEKGSDFRQQPLRFLTARPLAAGKTAFLEPDRRSMARMVDGEAEACEEAEAEILIDPFRKPVRILVWHGALRSGTYDHIRRVIISSTLGTIDQPADDIGMEYLVTRTEWHPIAGQDIPAE
jgi:prepilin-type N-terminal cleavage/methylation domain-containing protein